MNRTTFTLSSILLIVLSSCGLGEIDPADSTYGRSFFLLKEGRYVIYDVERITFDELNPNDTTFFEMREQVAGTSEGLDGQTDYRMERYIREKGQTQWKIDSVWTARLDGQKIVQVENNIPFIKMILPLENGRQWDGNRLNNLEEDIYQSDSLGKEMNVGDLFFPNTVHIIQNVDSSLVSRDVRLEVYADSVGLIYKRTELYKYITDTENPFYATDSIIGGLFLDMKVLDFGSTP